MDLKLKGKRVLILGSSSGLGFAIAKAYAEEGAIVGITSRDLKKAEASAAQIPSSKPFAVDLSQKNSGCTLIESFGHVDILITNAGGPPKGKFSDLSSNEWCDAYKGLWMSAIDTIKAALPYMKKQKWGRIIMSTSTSSREPIPDLTISNAYRPGLLGLMKSVSQEVAFEGITANAIMPGYTKTKRLEEFKISEENLVEDIPAKRLGLPEEFAALALFLGSEQAAYITGQAIACDGGLIRGI